MESIGNAPSEVDFAEHLFLFHCCVLAPFSGSSWSLHYAVVITATTVISEHASAYFCNSERSEVLYVETSGQVTTG